MKRSKKSCQDFFDKLKGLPKKPPGNNSAAAAVVIVVALAVAAAAAAHAVAAPTEEDDEDDDQPNKAVIATVAEHINPFLRADKIILCAPRTADASLFYPGWRQRGFPHRSCHTMRG